MRASATTGTPGTLSGRLAVVRPLLDVVDQREQLPLPIYLRLATQSEAVKSLVGPHVAEDRLDGGETLSVLFASPCAVDALAHTLAVGFLGLAGEYGDLACARGLGFAQALRA